MKILDIDKKETEITVKIENLNDLWTLYNVISKNDKAAARTQRRVVLREGSKGERKPMFLKLNVETVSFHEFSNRLRIKGTILEGPDDFVSFGTYHTFNIEIGQKLTMIKERWLESELKRLKDSSKFESNFVIYFIAIEQGLATLETITNYSHNRIATIKPYTANASHNATTKKALKKFSSRSEREDIAAVPTVFIAHALAITEEETAIADESAKTTAVIELKSLELPAS